MTFHEPHSDSESSVPSRTGPSPTPWDPEDPRWSAYLLGEMSLAERLAVEAVLEEDPAARHDFEDLADAADLVRLAFEAAPRPAAPPQPAETSSSSRPIVPALPANGLVHVAPASSSGASAAPKRRLRPGGPFVFIAAVASLGLCLMLVVQNPPRSGMSDSWEAAPAVAPIAAFSTFDAPDFGSAGLEQQPRTILAAVAGKASGEEDPVRSFRLTPSLALSYWSDSPAPVDALAVAAPNTGSLDGVWYRTVEENRSLAFRADTEAAARFSDERLGIPVPLQRGGQHGLGTRGRGSEALHDRPGVTMAGTPLLQLAESEAKQQVEPELREVLLVSRFQTPATVPVAAIPIQVGRQSMMDVEQSLSRGEWPAPESIRLEEMVNAFEYDDPLPTGENVAELCVEGGPCPWNERHRLVRIGLRAEPVDLSGRPTFRAVFVVDSRRPATMAQFNESLVEASQHFSALDRVTVVDASGMISLPTVAGDQLEDRIRSLRVDSERVATPAASVDQAPSRMASGQVPVPTPNPRSASVSPVQSLGLPPLSTAGAVRTPPMDSDAERGGQVFSKAMAQQPQVALENAYEVARENFIAGANNSVVLLTDAPLKGVEANNTQLMQNVRSYAESGVNLNALDVNANYSNPALHDLIDVGNGRVNTVSTPGELSEAVVQELAGGKSVVATEVELQIEFNPVRVEAYRLLGYEHWDRGTIDPRLLAGQKELRAGDRLSAVIEVRLNPETSSTLASLPLRYRQSSDFFVDVAIQDGEPPSPPVDHEKEWLTARLIFTPPGSSLPRVREVPFDGDGGSSSPALDWAACVVDFGERLKQPERLTTAGLQGIRRRAEGMTGADPLGTRQRFLSVLDQAIDLTGRSPQPRSGPAALPSGEARAKATCEGRYRDLLDKVAIPGDYARYGAFHDLGFQPLKTYQGHADLPAGHWVYVYPHWYIWGSAEGQVFMAAPPPAPRAP